MSNATQAPTDSFLTATPRDDALRLSACLAADKGIPSKVIETSSEYVVVTDDGMTFVFSETGSLFNFVTQRWETVNIATDKRIGNGQFCTPPGLEYEVRGGKYHNA